MSLCRRSSVTLNDTVKAGESIFFMEPRPLTLAVPFRLDFYQCYTFRSLSRRGTNGRSFRTRASVQLIGLR